MLSTAQEKIHKEIIENPELLISKLKDADVIDFEFNNADTSWIESILKSVTAEYEPENPASKPDTLKAIMSLKRDSDREFGEFLIVSGAVSGHYRATCVKCLCDIDEKFENSFNVAYVNNRYENDPEYEELDEIFIAGEVRDLYFHNRGKANLSEVIIESTILGINRYPLCKEECRGLCAQCGNNRNLNECGH